MNFKSGDVVKIKSGSPLMTIESIGQYNSITKAKCIWFEGSKKNESLFELGTLVVIETT